MHANQKTTVSDHSLFYDSAPFSGSGSSASTGRISQVNGKPCVGMPPGVSGYSDPQTASHRITQRGISVSDPLPLLSPNDIDELVQETPLKQAEYCDRTKDSNKHFNHLPEAKNTRTGVSSRVSDDVMIRYSRAVSVLYAYNSRPDAKSSAELQREYPVAWKRGFEVARTLTK